MPQMQLWQPLETFFGRLPMEPAATSKRLGFQIHNTLKTINLLLYAERSYNNSVPLPVDANGGFFRDGR
jgi:hypothetical protein